MEQGRDRSLIDVVSEAIRGALMETHTALPGRIEAFDSGTQTATVSIELHREFKKPDGTLETVSIPDILEVPVLFPRAGGFSITFPVQVGDKCLLIFSERDISGWMQSGEAGLPPEARKHAYSDAVAVLGLWPSTNPISPAPSATALQIRSDDGGTKIEVSAAGIATQTGGASGVTVAATAGPFTVDATGAITLTRGASELLDLLSQTLNALATDDVASVPLTNAATYAALKLLVDLMKTP